MEHEFYVAKVRAALDAATLRAPMPPRTEDDARYNVSLAHAQTALDRLSVIVAHSDLEPVEAPDS